MDSSYFNELGPSVSATDIDSVEEQFSVTLPAEYRTFLLSFNGGWLKPNSFGHDRIPGRNNILEHLLSVKGNRHTNFSKWNEWFRDEVSSEGVLIGFAGGSCLVSLRLRDFAVIYIDLYWADEAGEQAFKIAESFAQFVEMIRLDDQV